MKILLFGKGGQVGWELQRSLACMGELISLSTTSKPLCGDFYDLDGIAATVQTVSPDVIVNAAAYTAVDRAESEPALCRLLNAEGPGVLARQAARSGALLLHFSSDYVFDGSGSVPRSEGDTPGPLSVYGCSKLEGEQLIAASGCRHIILRTSWVYAARGNNFAKTMLRLACEREHLTVVDDQIGAPTGADLIADVSAHVIRQALQRTDMNGIYHLSASGHTSWHGYASFVIEYARQAGIDIKVAAERITAVSSAAFPTPAQRPKNSRLDTRRLQAEFGLTLPHWQVGVQRMLTEIFETLFRQYP